MDGLVGVNMSSRRHVVRYQENVNLWLILNSILNPHHHPTAAADPVSISTDRTRSQIRFSLWDSPYHISQGGSLYLNWSSLASSTAAQMD